MFFVVHKPALSWCIFPQISSMISRMAFMTQVIGSKSSVPRAEQRWQSSKCVFPEGHKPAEKLPLRWMWPLTDLLQILLLLGKINWIHSFFSLHHCLQLPTVYHSLSDTLCVRILTLTVHKQLFPADNWNVCGANSDGKHFILYYSGLLTGTFTVRQYRICLLHYS